MILNINPNRMELIKLRKRLLYAQKGHDLLEDKLQEMVRMFNELLKKTLELEKELEKELISANRNTVVCRLLNKKKTVLGFLERSKITTHYEIKTQNFLGIKVPFLKLEISSLVYPQDLTSLDLELGLKKWVEILPRFVKLAQQVKTCQILAKEIEYTRRRVNALEYILIPSIQQTMRYISEKLTEFERASLLRLLRIKEIILKSQLPKKN